MIDKMKEIVKIIELFLLKIENLVKNNSKKTIGIGIGVVGVIIVLLLKKIISFSLASFLIFLILAFLAIFMLNDCKKDVIIGLAGVFIAIIMLCGILFKIESLKKLISTFSCILVSILVLYDSIKEKRVDKNITTLQMYRIILSLALVIIIIIINYFLRWDTLIDIWSAGSFLIYFVPLVINHKNDEK